MVVTVPYGTPHPSPPHKGEGAHLQQASNNNNVLEQYFLLSERVWAYSAAVCNASACSTPPIWPFSAA